MTITTTTHQPKSRILYNCHNMLVIAAIKRSRAVTGHAPTTEAIIAEAFAFANHVFTEQLKPPTVIVKLYEGIMAKRTQPITGFHRVQRPVFGRIRFLYEVNVVLDRETTHTISCLFHDGILKCRDIEQAKVMYLNIAIEIYAKSLGINETDTLPHEEV